MHDLESGGKNHIAVAVCAVVILVNVAADKLNAFRFLHRGKDAVSGCARRHEHNVNAFRNQGVSHYLAGRLVRKGSHIVAAHVCAGHIGSRIRCELNDLNALALCLVYIFHAALKSVLIVYVGGISDTVYNRNLVGSCLKGCRHSCKETGFLLGKLHGVNVVHYHFVAVRIGRKGVNQDKFHVRILLCHRGDSRKLEAAAHDHVIIGNNVRNCLDCRRHVARGLLYRCNGSIRIGLDKG